MTDQQVSAVAGATANSAATASSHPLDPTLFSLGIALRGLEVEAYMRDELHHGGSSLEAVTRRVLAGRKQDMGEAFQELSEQMEDVWEKVKQDYDPLRDRRAGHYRSQALRILDENLHWLRKHDERGTHPDALGPQSGRVLTQMMSLLSQVLAALNRGDAHLDLDLSHLLEAMESASREIIGTVAEDIVERSADPVPTSSTDVH